MVYLCACETGGGAPWLGVYCLVWEGGGLGGSDGFWMVGADGVGYRGRCVERW